MSFRIFRESRNHKQHSVELVLIVTISGMPEGMGNANVRNDHAQF
ncbi:hypothetical protein [secondary endosymbiont of Ctenarytaina eucalypti]|nr:hypothetical protein [secondary endosymbiont of Ctenarytaina eucalypti]